MMSERTAIISRTVEVEVEIGWTELFATASKLFESTLPTDVNWKHVERARNLWKKMEDRFYAKREDLMRDSDCDSNTAVTVAPLAARKVDELVGHPNSNKQEEK